MRRCGSSADSSKSKADTAAPVARDRKRASSPASESAEGRAKASKKARPKSGAGT